MNHVLLVSDQPMPNFLPILNKEIKPDSVTLVVSSKMKKRAEWLKTEIGKHQVAVHDDIDVGDDVSDINRIQDTLANWADANKELLERSVLNVTGGTKPMAIAAQEVFRLENRPVFYVDIATDKVTWLDVKGKKRECLTLSNQPTLNQFLGMNGIQIESGNFRSNVENEKWRHFYGEIAANPQKWGRTVGAINHIAAQAEDSKNVDFQVDGRTLDLPYWQEMVELLHADELVRYRNGTRNQVFASTEARRFCNGIWLEHYVFELLKSFGFDKKRAMMNVKIVNDEGVSNELDAIVLHANTCYVIEDKARNMKREAVADNAVYKLAQLSSQMGLRAKGILVSAFDVRQRDKDRAKAYHVDVFDSLPDLKSDLEKIFRLSR